MNKANCHLAFYLHFCNGILFFYLLFTLLWTGSQKSIANEIHPIKHLKTITTNTIEIKIAIFHRMYQLNALQIGLFSCNWIYECHWLTWYGINDTRYFKKKIQMYQKLTFSKCNFQSKNLKIEHKQFNLRCDHSVDEIRVESSVLQALYQLHS